MNRGALPDTSSPGDPGSAPKHGTHRDEGDPGGGAERSPSGTWSGARGDRGVAPKGAPRRRKFWAQAAMVMLLEPDHVGALGGRAAWQLGPGIIPAGLSGRVFCNPRCVYMARRHHGSDTVRTWLHERTLPDVHTLRRYARPRYDVRDGGPQVWVFGWG